MLLRWFRHHCAPFATLTTVVFCNATFFTATVRAAVAERSAATPADRAQANASYDDASRAALSGRAQKGGGSVEEDSAAAAEAAVGALPSAGGGVSAQATALPSGAATQLGMGESFTTQLSTGVAGYSVPIALPAARGRVQPRLDLSYSSGGGFGLAGVGWSMGGAAISRQTDRGLPKYDDRGSWHPEQDRFVFGGMELVPICTVTGSACAGALATEVMPSWANGWQYFRARVEGGYLRFFWSADHRSWRVQARDGTNMEFGVPLDGTGYEGALERNPAVASETFRWYLVRQYDSEGSASSPPSPVNTIVYRYGADGNVVYLTDIFDTSPAATPTTTDLATYAHHTTISYEARPDPGQSYRAGFLQQVARRVSHVDVTSKPFSGGGAAPRELVRRYYLAYEPNLHRSLLKSVQMEGRCSSPITEDGGQSLPSTNCPRLPAVSFEYQRVEGGNAPLRDSQGLDFDRFDTKVRSLGQSPPHSLDDRDVALADVNADGLPDVLVTSPGTYSGRHGLYLNGEGTSGAPGFGRLSTMPVVPAADVTDVGVLSLHSATVTALDLDGDGILNLVHMPQAKRMGIFSPELVTAGEYRWVGRSVETASQQDIKIDFTHDQPNTRVMDVDGDGLVDVVFSSATELQTFFALGRYPGGDGQFGHATWTSASSANISNEPVVACIPWSSTPVRFSNADTFLADMNGDGFVDIVRVRDGLVQYWPGRGTGYWGTGDRQGCASGFGENREVPMSNAPRFGVADPGTLLLNDVNGDGYADMVEVRKQGVDIYLNDNGTGWTERQIIDQTPTRPAASNYVRLTDINGSGTPDILWGHAHEYQYIDLTGGKVPHLLVRVKNGLGKTAELTYASSAELMLAAANVGERWTSVAPLTMPVLVRAAVRDNLERIGRAAGVYATEYTYRDPLYDGRQREFRGFAEAVVKSIGDRSEPTSFQRSVFQLGACTSGGTACAPAERWQDNGREGLKGLPVLSETYDENGVYLTTQHTTYELRQLYAGLDGRRVIAPAPVATDGYAYDTAKFDRATQSVALDEVRVKWPGASTTEARNITLRATAGTAHLRSETAYDDVGNTVSSTQYGCVSGCPAGDDDAITSHSVFGLVQGDASGWLYREQQSYITSVRHPERMRERSHTYTPSGMLESSFIMLSGTLALRRRHADNAPIAPNPMDQSGGMSAPVLLRTSHAIYDTFGNATVLRGPSGRCASRQFDTEYAELVASASAMAGELDTATGCGRRTFTHRVTYDRGLRMVLTSTNAAGQPSRYDYDGFGRVTSITGPDPGNSGHLAAVHSMEASYELPVDADATPYTTTIVRAQDGPDVNAATYREARSIADGLGRSIVSLSPADRAAHDEGDWIASGVVEYAAKGTAFRSHDPWFYSGNPANVLGTRPPSTPGKARQFDAFGRTVASYGYDGTLEGSVVTHALSVDAWDLADLAATSHQGTYTTTVSDGHGRSVRRIERTHAGSSVVANVTTTDYRPTGEPERVVQHRDGQPDVVRWMRYDSLGRLVLNVEPNTSPDFNPDPRTPPDNIHAWRYAYNDAGDIVGYGDARGCGANFFYDTAGRLLAEDRSPCLGHQAKYSPPNLVTGDGTEAFYRYDDPDPETGSVVDDAGQRLNVNVNLLAGHLVSVAGLGSKAVFAHDSLGRSTGVAVRIQRPGAASTTLADRYAARWYIKTQAFDSVGRVTSATTGATTPELLGSDHASRTTYQYSRRGLVQSIGGSYGNLYVGGIFDASGRAQQMTLGDLAGTTRSYNYDGRFRVSQVQTTRGAPPLWTANQRQESYVPPLATDDPTRQLVLENNTFGYDEVNNLTAVEDHRVAAEWPETAKPVTRRFQYDDFYRLTSTSYRYSGAESSVPDRWKSPFDNENRTAEGEQPVPQVSFAHRVAEQHYGYDHLGNIVRSTDDQNGFWDRSTGIRTHGTATSGPHQVRSASNRSLAPNDPRRGDLSAAYDDAGNLTTLVTRREGPCLPSTASCWQRFAYEWDEVGQLVRAERWDLAATPDERSGAQVDSPPPSRRADADLRYAYDASGTRVLKTVVDRTGVERHTVYIFGGLEVRGTEYESSSDDYALAPAHVFLRIGAGFATARVLYAEHDIPTLTSGRRHLFLVLSDTVGSSTAIIDHATSELVEYSTYQTYGAIESDYRPGRWAEYRDPYKFGGKEEDIQVGLAYFGARFYSPYLCTWTSPDPVTIHDMGSDPNPYAYVHGTPLMAVDPDGRMALFVVPLLAIAAGALISGGASYITQASSGGTVQWGLKGVAGAAVVGGIAAGVTFGVGSIPAVAATGAVGAGAVGGAAGGLASYSAGAALGFHDFSAGGLTKATVTGAMVGTGSAIAAQWGAAVGGAGAGKVGGMIAGSVTGSAAGYAIGAGLTGEKLSWEGLGLAAGQGIAQLAASEGTRALAAQENRDAAGPEAGHAQGGPTAALTGWAVGVEGESHVAAAAHAAGPDERVAGPGGGPIGPANPVPQRIQKYLDPYFLGKIPWDRVTLVTGKVFRDRNTYARTGYNKVSGMYEIEFRKGTWLYDRNFKATFGGGLNLLSHHELTHVLQYETIPDFDKAYAAEEAAVAASGGTRRNGYEAAAFLVGSTVKYNFTVKYGFPNPQTWSGP